jgi:hypothetical protein
MLRSRSLQLALLLLSGAACAAPLSSPAPEAGVRVFTLRAEALQHARERIDAGDPSLRPALDRLIDEADEALRAGPFSVMDKDRLPPSGDKHDYMSFGPYWWPDPTRPDGLPYIRRDGERNPESLTGSDREPLGRMIGAVTTIGLAYHFTDDERYASRAATLLRTWFIDPATRMNPHLEYGQAIPGVTEGRGIGIIDTGGLAQVVDAIGMLRRSPSWRDADQRGLEQWFAEYLEWLRTSEKGREERDWHNNHGTWWDVQAVSFALFVGDTAAARKILAGTRERIGAHIMPDGSQPHELERTRSLSYSAYNLDAFTRLAELSRHVGEDLWSYRTAEGASIRGALDYLAPYAGGGREWPHPQITPIEADFLLLQLRRAAIALRPPAYADAIARIPAAVAGADRSRLLYPGSTPDR